MLAIDILIATLLIEIALVGAFAGDHIARRDIRRLDRRAKRRMANNLRHLRGTR